MRTGIQLFIVASAIALPAGPLSATHPDAELRHLFEGFYADYGRGVRDMDQRRWQKYLASDFVMISPDGKRHTAAEMKKYVEINARTTKRVLSYSNSIEALTRVSPTTVAAIILQKYVRVQAPEETPSEGHEIRTSVVQREWWRKTPKGWRQYRVEELLTGPDYLDGKIVTD
jgi:hypothetical protein